MTNQIAPYDLQNQGFAGTPLPGILTRRDHAREIFSFFTVLHRRSNGCRNRLWHSLGFDWPNTAFGRSFNFILYCGLLPFPAEQNVGVPVPPKRLYQATYTIFRSGHCQLVDHNCNRAPLPANLHHQRLNRQTICTSSGNLSCIPFNAVLCVSKVALLPISLSRKKNISHGGHGIHGGIDRYRALFCRL